MLNGVARAGLDHQTSEARLQENVGSLVH